MRFVQAAEIVFGFLIGLFVLYQIIWPMIRGTPVLPWLRTRESLLEYERSKARQRLVENEIEDDIKRIQSGKDAT